MIELQLRSLLKWQAAFELQIVKNSNEDHLELPTLTTRSQYCIRLVQQARPSLLFRLSCSVKAGCYPAHKQKKRYVTDSGNLRAMPVLQLQAGAVLLFRASWPGSYVVHAPLT